LYPPRFALAAARKDADLIHESAPGLRVAAAARSWLADAEQHGLGGEDYSAVLREIAGTV
jgi:3-hydroxyisobutyrate dehydrogenase/2-hydroxy-3-oxopropionate reductase